MRRTILVAALVVLGASSGCGKAQATQQPAPTPPALKSELLARGAVGEFDIRDPETGLQLVATRSTDLAMVKATLVPNGDTGWHGHTGHSVVIVTKGLEKHVRSYWPVVRELRFRPIAAPAVLDGREYTTVVLDFGPDSVDGWLVDVLATELGLADEPTLDSGAHELTVRGEPVALTPLEFGLFRHLREREGRTVTRPELLRDVWSTEYRQGSNVVDAVVHTLRAKLGTEASVIEAVRGRGYRLREDWRVHLQ